MENSENERHIRESVAKRHCANCGADLDETGIVGSGSFSDGLFCSLDCYARSRQGVLRSQAPLTGRDVSALH